MTVLTGCNSGGGESGGQGSSDTQPTQLLVTQTRSVVDIESQSQQVDLSNAVEVISGSSATLGSSDAELTSVVSLSAEPQCHQVAISDTLSFTTTYDKPATCVLEYTVQSDDGIEASDIVQIDATKVIPVIPKFFDTLHVNTALNGSADVDIDLDSLLNIPAGISLDAQNITVTGEGSAVGAGNVITFTPSQATGVSEIFYSMENSAQDLAISGAIRVVVSEDASTAPDNSTPNKDVGQQEVYQEFEVNLSDFITAQSGEPLKIIDINNDPYTEVSIKDSMKIAITPTLPGKSQVSYIVTDHNGGSVTGSINFEGKQYQAKVVGNGTQSMLISRPILHSIFSQSSNSPVEGYTDIKTGYKVANVTWNQANDYCSSLGMNLPSADELVDFSKLPLFSQHNWATSNYYWSQTKSGFGENESVRLSDGDRIPNSDTDLRGVVCSAQIPPNTPPTAQDIVTSGEIYHSQTITIDADDEEDHDIVISDVISDDDIDVQFNGLEGTSIY